MLYSLADGLVALALLIDGSSTEVRIASQSLASPGVLASVTRARKRNVPVYVVLGATAEYTLDANGQPTGPNRPFDKGPQGPELARLDSAGADTTIPPRFNEMGPSSYQPGVYAHMSYAVVDRKKAIVCTSALNARAPQGICAQVTEPARVGALRRLHIADHDTSLPRKEMARTQADLVRADVIATPDASSDLLLLVGQPWRAIYTHSLSDGAVLQSLVKSPHRPMIWISLGSASSRSAIERLRADGFPVQTATVHFGGTVMIGPSMVFLGSQPLDSVQITQSRDVGMLLPASEIQAALALASAWHLPQTESHPAKPLGPTR